MITESLRHCIGIGPTRLARLHDLGIRTWNDVIENASSIPTGIRAGLLSEVRCALAALERNDIGYFVGRLCPEDKWRILAEFFDQTSYFDIETSGLEMDSSVTVIVCWHQGRLQTFVEHENLDDFLDLLDDISLLASFNGASFDVPRILDTFHIPDLPCPHLDLRWLSFHAGLRGGLKTIERQLQISRPSDLGDIDGDVAVQLWARWRECGETAARDQLIRYCAADVLSLVMLAEHLAGIDRSDIFQMWSHLPAAEGISSAQRVLDRHALTTNVFGTASPSRLRTRRRLAE